MNKCPCCGSEIEIEGDFALCTNKRCKVTLELEEKVVGNGKVLYNWVVSETLLLESLEV